MPSLPFSGYNDENPVAAFITQQVCVPISCLVISFVLLLLIPEPPWSVVEAGTSGQILEITREVSVYGTVGFLFGCGFLRWIELPRATGKWIWVIPMLLLAASLIHDAFLFTWGESQGGEAFREFFFPGPNGEGWWAFAFFTCPLVSTLFYSLALWMNPRWCRRLRETTA